MEPRITPLPPAAAAPGDAASALRRVAFAPPGAAPGFSQALREAAPGEGPTVTVRPGDTLVGLVKGQMRAQNLPVSDRQAYSLALQVARDNGLVDPNRLRPGQSLRLDALSASLQAGRAVRPGLPVAHEATAAAASPPSTAAVLAGRQANPLFERTLSRAVERGFIPPHEAEAVRDRVSVMAQDYGFALDDFARVVLIESDGFNPAASNGRCHGVIQFCGGPGRGAASVGYARNPEAITRMSVLQQLELVDRYFEDVGLQDFGGKVGLEDLYLSVLTPAARAQRSPDAPLPIPGLQARVLYEGGQREGPITRRSIAAGLARHAQERLADGGAAAPLAQVGSLWPPRRQ